MRRFPDRREGVRIVTLKNAAWTFGILLVIFVAVSAWNELKPDNASRERLYERGSVVMPPAREAAKASEDREVSDETFAGHRAGAQLAAPVARSEAAPPPPPAPKRRPTLNETKQRGGKIVISGNADGLRVDVAPATATTTAVPPDRFF